MMLLLRIKSYISPFVTCVHPKHTKVDLDLARIRSRSSNFSLSASRSSSVSEWCLICSRSYTKNAPLSSISKETKEKLSYSKLTLGRLMDVYEDVVGLAEVKQAQEKVVNAEQKFLQVQEDRRAMQQELHTIQAEVRTVGAELEKTSRTDTHYIDLVKKEHEILLIEREMNNKLKTLDKAERDFFSLLSAALRESHEKERSRAEKTKYWSIIGSIIGAVIGIVGSTINNVKRMKELRAIVEESAQNTDSYKLLINRLLDNATEEQLNIHPDHLLKDTRKVRGLAFLNHEELKKHTDLILSSVESSSEMIFSQINILKDTISFQTVGGDKTNISCSSNILEGEMLVKDIQEKLDTSIKKNIWISTTVLSGIITIGLSVIVYILRGSD